MDMESKNFLKSKLGELHSKFPNLSIKYQYDAYTQNHIVEIIPLDEFEKNEDYIAFESDLCFEFDNRFFPEVVMFVSEESLTRVQVPELLFYPVLVKSFVNIGYTHKFRFNSSGLQHNYTATSEAFAA